MTQPIVAECWTCRPWRMPLNRYGSALHKIEGHDVRARGGEAVSEAKIIAECEVCGKRGKAAERCEFAVGCSCWYGVPCINGESMRHRAAGHDVRLVNEAQEVKRAD